MCLCCHNFLQHPTLNFSSNHHCTGSLFFLPNQYLGGVDICFIIYCRWILVDVIITFALTLAFCFLVTLFSLLIL
ncbi:hypothetical protein VNO77_33188 [Canavalia gladiata]|uniref:Uncharacterized protein n=1 Tax=Canavalia gladiata TaxID=3824 RepID=A0AAN9PXH4_CANGL